MGVGKSPTREWAVPGERQHRVRHCVLSGRGFLLALLVSGVALLSACVYDWDSTWHSASDARQDQSSDNEAGSDLPATAHDGPPSQDAPSDAGDTGPRDLPVAEAPADSDIPPSDQVAPDLAPPDQMVLEPDASSCSDPSGNWEQTCSSVTYADSVLGINITCTVYQDKDWVPGCPAAIGLCCEGVQGSYSCFNANLAVKITDGGSWPSSDGTSDVIYVPSAPVPCLSPSGTACFFSSTAPLPTANLPPNTDYITVFYNTQAFNPSCHLQ